MPSSRISSVALPAVLGALLLAASTAPVASAAPQRYASPAGSGTACSSASPCSITEAVEHANPGDEVIAKPGDYPLTSTLNAPYFGYDSIAIHGVAGQPRPRLMFSGAAQVGLRMPPAGTLRYVEIDQASSASALFADEGAEVDEVIAKAHGGGVVTVTTHGATVRNSIVVASGTNASALQSESYAGGLTDTYRNVTAVASGPGALPIDARATTGASMTVHLFNVIAYAGPGALSMVARTDNSGATATITATHTDYQSADALGAGATIDDGGGNRADVPAFVNPAAGDYREAPGSYTIDAGANDPANGAHDVDGDPRTIGTTDIGADEFVPAPVATTGPAGAVSTGSAKLAGSVNPKGTPTTYRFQYGRTTAYGADTAITGAGSGTGTLAAAATLAGLQAGTTYHYRLVATNSGGTTKGADRTFTTIAPPTPTPPFAGVKLTSRRLAYRQKAIALKLSCPADTAGRCTGRAKLTARHVRLGRASFSIAAGHQAKVKLHVTRAGRRLLARVHRLRATERNTAHDTAGHTRTTAAKVRIRHD